MISAAEPPHLRSAYAHCEALAQSHYENFPVASRLMPAALRPHVAAIYAFARTADDFADEPRYPDGDRLRLLGEWRARLHPPARLGASARQVGVGDDAIFTALHDTIDRFSLPVQLFDDLLDAFVQDVSVTRYETWAAVLDYCRRSANPVGRLVLMLNGYRDEQLCDASDAVCTALQLTNFWQDLATDWERGRLYVPAEIWAAHLAEPAALDAGQMSPPWTAALRDCGRRTRTLFTAGREVCDGVSGRLRYELRATWLGGSRILDRLERSGFDVFTARPTLGAADTLVIAFGTLLWRETRPSPTRS